MLEQVQHLLNPQQQEDKELHQQQHSQQELSLHMVVVEVEQLMQMLQREHLVLVEVLAAGVLEEQLHQREPLAKEMLVELALALVIMVQVVEEVLALLRFLLIIQKVELELQVPKFPQHSVIPLLLQAILQTLNHTKEVVV